LAIVTRAALIPDYPDEYASIHMVMNRQPCIACYATSHIIAINLDPAPVMVKFPEKGTRQGISKDRGVWFFFAVECRAGLLCEIYAIFPNPGRNVTSAFDPRTPPRHICNYSKQC
jgi:hypothetical protein